MIQYTVYLREEIDGLREIITRDDSIPVKLLQAERFDGMIEIPVKAVFYLHQGEGTARQALTEHESTYYYYVHHTDILGVKGEEVVDP